MLTKDKRQKATGRECLKQRVSRGQNAVLCMVLQLPEVTHKPTHIKTQASRQIRHSTEWTSLRVELEISSLQNQCAQPTTHH